MYCMFPFAATTATVAVCAVLSILLRYEQREVAKCVALCGGNSGSVGGDMTLINDSGGSLVNQPIFHTKFTYNIMFVSIAWV